MRAAARGAQQPAAPHGPISSLADHDGYWLRMVSNAVSHEFARRLAEEGVTVAEWVVLRTLYDLERIAPSVLAQRMGLTKGAISKLAERLLRKRLIVRQYDRNDRRAQRLSLTPAGRALVPVLARIADRNDADYFGVLSATEREAFKALLASIIERRAITHVPLS